MKYKVITTDGKKVVVNESAEIKEVTEGYYYDFYEKACPKITHYYESDEIQKTEFKIIATINHSISLNVPMIIVEDEVEKLAEHSSEVQEGTYTHQHKVTYKHGFIDGYKKAQQKGVYSEEDLRVAINKAYLIGIERSSYGEAMEDDIIQSLKQEYIELEMDLYCELKDCIEQNPNCVLPNNGVCKAQEVIKTNRDKNGQLIAYEKITV